jgi:hypothetical protein
VPVSAADPVAAAAAVGAAGAKKPAAGAKAGSKDKGARDAGAEVPSWVPPGPVFPRELNEQWQQLMQKVGPCAGSDGNGEQQQRRHCLQHSTIC